MEQIKRIDLQPEVEYDAPTIDVDFATEIALSFQARVAASAETIARNN